MDPVTTAIVTALASEAAKGIAKKSYQAIRSLFVEKKGANSNALDALASLESKPDSKGRQSTLDEEIVAVSLHQDDQIKQLAQALLDDVKSDESAKPILKQFNAEKMVVIEGGNQGNITFGNTHIHNNGSKKNSPNS